jgi:BirA family biotin operon repressor/biotin-[acetyl-CoA-carboxylase] ligase
VLAAILAELAGVHDVFAARRLREDWQRFHAWQACPCRFSARAAVQGVCLGVDDDGSLLLDTAQGIERIFSGDVSLRRSETDRLKVSHDCLSR